MVETMRKKKSVFPPDVESYLGKYKIKQFQDMYDVCETIMVICEDGKMFVKSPPFGIQMLDYNPYKMYNKMIESLVEDIRKRIELATPMDRKMRQT